LAQTMMLMMMATTRDLRWMSFSHASAARVPRWPPGLLSALEPRGSTLL
jgi:hypothetical protein